MTEKNFSKLLQNYVNKDFDQLLLLANEALGIIAVAYKRVNPEGGAMSNFLLPFIATAVVVDEQYTELEHKFVNSLLESNFTYEEGKACIKQFDITFPNLKHISSFKKIDYYLWNIGK